MYVCDKGEKGGIRCSQEQDTHDLLQIKDSVGNDYGRPKDVAGEQRMAFTSLADSAFDVCFENTLTGRGMLFSDFCGYVTY
jgi:hypothetical protein